jgi:hypothetical protein
MTPISSAEFDQMERLLADLLVEASPAEESQILQVHMRLKAIFEAQRGLQDTKSHLLSLTGQNP